MGRRGERLDALAGVRVRNLLLLSSYTRSGLDSEASDEIGYGISAGGVLRRGLSDAGFHVRVLSADPDTFDRRIDYIHACYIELSRVPLHDLDAIVLFHAFHQFPAEIRRILANRGHPDLPIIGFTHGSHLDPTDEFRERLYPGMQMADLGNLMCLDRILVVSETFRTTLSRAVETVAPAMAPNFSRRLVVCGLAIDFDAISSCGACRPVDPERIAILFNHSPTSAKDPEAAFRVVGATMEKNESVDLVVTRKFIPGAPGYATLMDLRERFKARVSLQGTLALTEYYRVLWRTEVQVSTAHHETFGVATLEAMYAGNCCLVPDRQAYPELTGGVGLYQHLDELGRMLDIVVSDPEQRRAIARAQQRRSRDFDPDRMIRRVAGALEEVMAERAGLRRLAS